MTHSHNMKRKFPTLTPTRSLLRTFSSASSKNTLSGAAPAGNFSSTNSALCVRARWRSAKLSRKQQSGAAPQALLIRLPAPRSHQLPLNPLGRSAKPTLPPAETGREPRRATLVPLVRPFSFVPVGHSTKLSAGTAKRFPAILPLAQTTPSTAAHRPISAVREREPPTLVGAGNPRALGKLKHTFSSPPSLDGGFRSGTTGNPQYRLPEQPQASTLTGLSAWCAVGSPHSISGGGPQRPRKAETHIPEAPTLQVGVLDPIPPQTPEYSLPRTTPSTDTHIRSGTTGKPQYSFPEHQTTPTSAPDTLRELRRIASLLNSLKPILREDRVLELED